MIPKLYENNYNIVEKNDTFWDQMNKDECFIYSHPLNNFNKTRYFNYFILLLNIKI